VTILAVMGASLARLELPAPVIAEADPRRPYRRDIFGAPCLKWALGSDLWYKLCPAMSRFGLSARFAGYYGAVFLALGVYLPFWPVWLAERGLTAADIGLLLALTSWVKVLSVPPVARLADRTGRVKAAIVLLAAASLASFAAFLLTERFWSILVVQLLTAFAFHGLIPLGESHTMRAVGGGELDYGRVRLWGSVGFILGALGTGELLTRHDPGLVLWLVLVALALTLCAALGLPERRDPLPEPGTRPRVRALLGDRRFLLFLTAAALLQASHAVYYGFSALAWRASGLSDAAVGWLWAEGVLAEILFFAASGTLLRRGGPRALLVLAGLGGVVRWSVLAATTALPALIAAQGLHALTFGAAHLGAVHFIARHAPQGLAATAQGLYAALSGGLAMGLAALLAGRLYGAFEARAFLAMTILSAAGLVLALVLGRPRTTAS
jgi:PPP family 3-phenylpropionic acid transporter